MPISVQGGAVHPAFPETGFLRLADVLRLVPVCKTVWYAGVKSGKFPKPVALGARARGYRVADIRALIERLNAGEEA